MTPSLPWTPSILHDELRAWIACDAHAVPRSDGAPPALTEPLLLDALERRVHLSLTVDIAAADHLDAALHLLAAVALLRAELRLPSDPAAPLPTSALEAAADLHDRALVAHFAALRSPLLARAA